MPASTARPAAAASPPRWCATACWWIAASGIRSIPHRAATSCSTAPHCPSTISLARGWALSSPACGGGAERALGKRGGGGQTPRNPPTGSPPPRLPPPAPPPPRAGEDKRSLACNLTLNSAHPLSDRRHVLPVLR